MESFMALCKELTKLRSF